MTSFYPAEDGIPVLNTHGKRALEIASKQTVHSKSKGSLYVHSR